jgi:hypothetical protein
LLGADGATGPQGPQGIAGNDGATGPMGPQGPAGNDGAVGPQGPQGIAGNDGATGPQGPQGIAGNDGATGPMGPQGPAGNDGATGPQGPIGLTGPQGPTGLLANGAAAGNTPYWNGTAWVTNSSNIFNNGGDIGIGTNVPFSKLDINVTNTTGLLIRGGNPGHNLASSQISFGYAGGTDYRHDIRTRHDNAGTTLNTIDFYIWTPVDGAGNRATQQVMTLNGAGNVGIGIATPGAKLEVAGQVKITGGTPGVGKVLTSDATGLATWQAPADASPTNELQTLQQTSATSFQLSNGGGSVNINVNDADASPTNELQNLTYNSAANTLAISSGNTVSLNRNCAFYANLSADMATTGINTLIPFNTEIFDLGSNYDNATGTFTAPAAGVYQFHTGIWKNEPAGTRHSVQIFKNGVFLFTMDYSWVETTHQNARSASFILQLGAGETVQIAAYQQVGTTIRGGVNTFFQGFRVQ